MITFFDCFVILVLGFVLGFSVRLFIESITTAHGTYRRYATDDADGVISVTEREYNKFMKNSRLLLTLDTNRTENNPLDGN